MLVLNERLSAFFYFDTFAEWPNAANLTRCAASLRLVVFALEHGLENELIHFIQRDARASIVSGSCKCYLFIRIWFRFRISFPFCNSFQMMLLLEVVKSIKSQTIIR